MTLRGLRWSLRQPSSTSLSWSRGLRPAPETRRTEEINLLRSDLSKLQSSFSVREQNHKFETVSARLESHQELIEELKTEMQIQVTLQARMSQELDTVKDQVDVLREQVHTSARYSQDIGEIKSRVSELEQVHTSARYSQDI